MKGDPLPMNQMKKTFLALLALLLALSLSTGAAEEAASGQASSELFGSPWPNTNALGNLPAAAPEEKDDFYTSVNYDALAANQNSAMYMPLLVSVAEIEPAVTALVQDGSVSVPGMDQLKIFWEQAADIEALRNAGISEVKPYLDRIAAASSIEELNAVLTSDDFPFSPYVVMPVAPLALNEENGVWLYPAFSVTSDFSNGPNAYTETVADAATLLGKVASQERAFYLVSSLSLLGVEDDILGTLLSLFNMEAGYAKEGYSEAKAGLADYGYISNAPHRMTAEEIGSLCSRFPLAATLKKFGKDKTSAFVVPYPAWLQALDSIWTDENLENVKLLTGFKVIMEASPFLDPEYGNGVRTDSGQPVMDANTNPWAVCNRADTFGHLLAGLYAEKVLGSELKETLTSITQGLIGTYRDLINETEWLSDNSRARALEKLDHMRLNILEPDGGYYDFSSLKLTPSSEGGSLFNSYLQIKAYLNDQENSFIGKPAKADLAWKAVNPLGTNCFYDPFSNSVNLLPGYMTSFTCPKDATEAEMMGGVGSVIAHEISHAFDFAGSQCDAFGLGNAILSEADLETFLAKVKALENYYDGITVLPGMNVKGTFQRVENTADLAGMKAAVKLAKSRNLDLASLFRANAKLDCMAAPAASLENTYNNDPHGAFYLRVNVCVQMIDEFYDTFEVKEGDGMYVKPEDRLCIWGAGTDQR